MYRINVTTFALLLVLAVGCLMSESLPTSDGSVKDLYDYLLQREYPAPVSYADHQIRRKAVRSPSLRLRFGRRSDPSMPVRPDDDDLLMDQKSIRAPQMRLRFGRTDPLWTSFNENALLDDAVSSLEKRAPSQRLRWGRSNLFSGLINQFQPDDVMQQKTIRAPQLRLRFGRTDPEWAVYNEHSLVPQLQSAELAEKRAPTQRLRWGRSDPALKETVGEGNNNNSNQTPGGLELEETDISSNAVDGK